MTQTQDEGLLTRWSRRKQLSTLESEKEDLDLDLQAQALAGQEISQPDPESTGELEVPVLTDADMPSVDSLTEESDFSGFMSSGVSDKLRNLALRKLFSSSIFNIRDGLDEYDEDYTYFEKLGDIVTADMKHQMELEEAEKLEQEIIDESPEESITEAVPIDEESSELDEAESQIATSEEDDSESDPPISDSDPEQQESIKRNSSESTTKNND